MTNVYWESGSFSFISLRTFQVSSSTDTAVNLEKEGENKKVYSSTQKCVIDYDTNAMAISISFTVYCQGVYITMNQSLQLYRTSKKILLTIFFSLELSQFLFFKMFGQAGQQGSGAVAGSSFITYQLEYVPSQRQLSPRQELFGVVRLDRNGAVLADY